MSNKAIELADKWNNTQSSSIVEFEKMADEMAAELRRLHAEVEGLRKDADKVKEGYKLVPVEPTDEMLSVLDGYSFSSNGRSSMRRGAWLAMLKAAEK